MTPEEQKSFAALENRVAHLEQEKANLWERDIALRTQLSQLANAGAAFGGWLSAEVLRSRDVLDKNKPK